jgi:hypothetical protein
MAHKGKTLGVTGEKTDKVMAGKGAIRRRKSEEE